MKNIMWINKMSKETGYVGSISKAKGYFMSVSDQAAARKFRTDKEVATAMATLESFGEMVNNDFEVVEL